MSAENDHLDDIFSFPQTRKPLLAVTTANANFFHNVTSAF
jgi:hypothetical protein